MKKSALRPRWDQEGGPAVAPQVEVAACGRSCAREQHGTAELV